MIRNSFTTKRIGPNETESATAMFQIYNTASCTVQEARRNLNFLYFLFHKLIGKEGCWLIVSVYGTVRVWHAICCICQLMGEFGFIGFWAIFLRRDVMKRAIVATFAVVLGLSAAADGVDIEWNVDSGGSWATTSNWDLSRVPGAGDNVVLGDVPTGSVTLTLDGNYTVDALAVMPGASGIIYTVNSGTPDPSRLTLSTGDMLFECRNRQAILTGIDLQIGDGVTAVTDAEWTTYSTTRSQGPNGIGKVYGIDGTKVTINGDGVTQKVGTDFSFRKTNNDYLGDWYIDQTKGMYVTLNADNAMGLGTVYAAASSWNTNLRFNVDYLAGGSVSAQTTHYNTFDTGTNALVMAVGDSGGGETATLMGPVTGSGTLVIGRCAQVSSTSYPGTLILANDCNTLSGDIEIQAGELRVDGATTQVGDIAVNQKGAWWLLSGSGTIGMATGKDVTISGDNYKDQRRYAYISAGDNDEVGTLAIGSDTTNDLELGYFSKMVVNIDETTPSLCDYLNISGSLKILGGVDNEILVLEDNGAFNLSGDYLLASFNSMSGTFDEVYYNGSLIGDPTAANSINGTHKLVYGSTSLTLEGAGEIPEPTTLLLLGTGLIGIAGVIRRKRMS